MDEAAGLDQAQLIAELDRLRQRVAELELTVEKEKKAGQPFSAFAQQSADGFFLADEQGNILEWNPAAETIFGVRYPQDAGLKIWDIHYQLLPDSKKKKISPEQIESSVRDFLKTGRAPWANQQVESEIQWPDDSRHFIQTVAFPIPTETGYMEAGIIRDITRRKLAEEELNRYHLLAENFRDILLYMDYQDGRILEANLAAQNAYQYSYQELLALTISDLRAPETLPDISPQMDKAFTTGAVFETVHRRKNGETFVVEVNSQRADYEGQPILISVIRDVTARKKEEDERKRLNEELEYRVLARTADLRQVNQQLQDEIAERARIAETLTASEQRYRTLFDQSPVSIWQEDFSAVKSQFDQLRRAGVTNFRDYFESHREAVAQLAATVHILNFNQRSVEFFGVNAKEEIVNNLPFYFTEESLEFFKEEMIALAEGHTSFNCEIPIRDLQQQRKVMALSLSVIPGYEETLAQVLVSFIDITGRKLAELAARKNEERLKQAVQIAKLGIWDWDIATDQVEWNEEMFRIYGIQASEFTGNGGDYINATREDYRKAQIDNIQQAFANGVTEADLMAGKGPAPDLKELCIVQPDGTERFTLGDAVSIVDAEGKPLRMLGVTYDITERRQIEEQLGFQATLLENISDAVVATDNQYRITSWNKAAEAIYGWTESEVLGKNVEDFFQIAYLNTTRNAVVKEYRETGKWVGESRQVRKDGSEIFIHSTSSKIIDAHGDHIGTVTINRDITEQKRAEETLRRSEAILSQAEKIAQMGSWEWNLENDEILVSEGWQRTHGLYKSRLTRAELIGLTHPDDLPGVQQNILDALACGKPYEYEHRILRPDTGEVRVQSVRGEVFCDSAGKPIRMVGATQDITERRQAEDALRRSEATLSLAEIMSHSGSWEWDIDRDEIIMSDGWRRISGYEQSRFTFNELIQFVLPEDMPIIQDALNNAYQGIDPPDLEVRVVRHDTGEVRWAKMSNRILRDESGIPYKIYGATQDIHERRQAEEKLRQSEALFAAFMENMPGYAYIINAQRRHVFVNKKYAELSEHSPDEWIGKTLEDFVPHPAAQNINMDDEAVLRKHEILQTEDTIGDGDQTRHLFSIKFPIFQATGEVLMGGISLDITDRKRVEQAYRESEESYHTLFDTMSLGVICYDSNGLIVSANPAAQKILGVSLNELLGKTSFNTRWNVIHADGIEFTREENPIVAALASNQPVQDVVMGITPPHGKSSIWLSVNAMPHSRPGESRPFQVYAIFEDVTEKKQAADILAARLRLHEFAFTHSLDELLQLTVDEAEKLTGSQISFYTFFDEEQQTLSQQAWSTRTLEEFCTAQPSDKHYRIEDAGVWSDCIHQRRPVIHNDVASLPHRKGTPSGHAAVRRELVVPVMRGDQIVAILGVGNKPAAYTERDVQQVTKLADLSWDIVKEKQIEDALLASEQRFRTVADFTHDWEYWRSPDSHFLYCSPSCERITGYTAQEFMQDSDLLIKITIPEDLPLHALHIQQKASGNQADSFDFRIVRRDGQVRWINHVCVPVRDAGGQFLGTRASNRDITERKQIEEALRFSEERFESLSRLSPTGIYMTDELGKCIYANPRWCEMAGLAPEQALGDGWIEGIYVEDRPVVNKAWNQMVESNGTWGCEYRFDNHKGKLTWVYGLAAPIHDSAGQLKGFVGTNVDITERKQIEEALAKKENLLEMAQQVTHLGSYEIDTANNTIYWTKETFLIAGLDPNGPAPSLETYTRIVHPEDVQKVYDLFGECLAAGEIFDLVYRLVRPDGEVRFVHSLGQPIRDAHGQYTRMIGSFLDITDHMRAQEAARAAEERFRLLYDKSYDGIIFTSPTGQIFSANPAACRILGWSEAEIIKNGRSALLDPKDPNLSSALEERSRTGHFRGKLTWLRKDGTRFPAETVSNIFLDKDGNERSSIFFRDITERVLLEDALRQAEAKYRGLFSEMMNGCALHEIICDSAGSPVDYITLDVNHAYERLLNAPREVVVGRKASEILPPEELRRWLGIFGPVALTGKSTYYEMVSPVNQKTFEGTAYCPEPGKFAVVFSDVTDRKQAEAKIRQAAEDLQVAQRVSHVGSWRWDIRNNHLEWSDEMYRIFGIDKASFTGFLPDVITRAIHPDDRLSVEQLNQLIIQGNKPYPLEYRVLWPDQSVHVVWGEAGGMILDEQGHPATVTGIVQDITERKKAEEALRKSEERFRALIEQSPAAVGITRGLKTLYANPRYLNLFGVERLEDILGHLLTEQIAPRDREIMASRAQRREEGLPAETEYEATGLRQDGSEFSFHASVTRVNLPDGPASYAIFTDITQRKLDEDALRMLSRAVEQSPVSIVVTNTLGDIEYVNPRFCELSGYTQDEILGRNPRILKSGLTPLETYQTLWNTITAGSDWKGELCNRKKNGELYWESVSIAPVLNDKGEIILFVGVKEDITEQKKSASLRNEVELLRGLDRMRDELISNVSHELRTPLGLILVMITALKKEALRLDSKTRTEFYQDIEDETRSLQNIVNNLLDISRLQSGSMALEWKPIDLRSLVQKVIKPIMANAASHTIRTHLPARSLMVSADSARIEQVIRNLVDNAMKYSPPGSFIDVHLKREEDVCRVEVWDQGVGIPFENQERIFERFYRIVDPNQPMIPGLGLGLAICRSIITAHGGSIWVEDRPEGGSRFIFTLPVKTDQLPILPGEEIS